MANASLPKTFNVFYAWAEGPWHGKSLVAGLKKAGFTEVPPSEATIIIAHSVGCYLVPQTKNNKVVILIGPPYWPGKSMGLRLLQKAWHDKENSSLRYWISKILWNIYYILTKPVIDIRAIRAAKSKDPFVKTETWAILIRNERDFFTTPDLASRIKNQVVSLPGQHDDCWHNPSPYVELIKKEYVRANRNK